MSSTLDSFTWFIKYFGLPLSAYASYRLYSLINLRKQKYRLQGKVVVITGASSGIGEALAHVFYECGCRVVLASRRVAELERVKMDLMSKDVNCKPLEPWIFALDLEKLDEIESFISNIHSTCGNIDILINNGGVSHRGSILHTNLDVDKKLMFINYFGSVAVTKAALPQMVGRKSGHIIFISSVQGLIAIPDRSAYAATKHALQAFGDSLRAEMRQHNINVSVVSPGYVQTAVSLNALTGSGTKHGVMDTSTAAGFTSEYVAKEILTMVLKQNKELIISQFTPRLAIFLRHAIPSMYFWVMSRRANKT